eukprot:TRINITY_DN7914_c0_g2_i1.p1 TRINITY_DN7914_c0_g2~~TRINITY_DN7914_c0_g2_i1.p1  ORF type:complete len:160 (-),score=15.57 TRINITY_DN7914_c0_g2_i1:38-517(-)
MIFHSSPSNSLELIRLDHDGDLFAVIFNKKMYAIIEPRRSSKVILHSLDSLTLEYLWRQNDELLFLCSETNESEGNLVIQVNSIALEAFDISSHYYYQKRSEKLRVNISELATTTLNLTSPLWIKDIKELPNGQLFICLETVDSILSCLLYTSPSPRDS